MINMREEVAKQIGELVLLNIELATKVRSLEDQIPQPPIPGATDVPRQQGGE